MKSEEWNNRLFVELVEQVGTPGDPLFLFVDEDGLARCTDGLLDPEEALADFCRAFNTLPSQQRFALAARSAQKWQKSGFVGKPPHLDALAMTVLASTLPPLGGAGNVYARQRQLLGLPDLFGGAPAGYVDYVPFLWKTWNQWLDGPGANFGVRTAVPAHLSYQGFARSQSFIRARDKEDIYDYFDSVNCSPKDEATPEELLEGLVRWLSKRPSRNARLLERASDSDYRDEFLSFLPTSLSFWAGERTVKTVSMKSLEIDGLLMWNQENAHFDVVVDLRRVRSLVGTEVQLLNGENYTVSNDPFLYLLDEGADSGAWFNDPIVEWPLNDQTNVSWFPRNAYVLADSSFYGWVEASTVEPGRAHRILLHADEVAAWQELEVGGEIHEAAIPGWSWLTDTRLDYASPETLAELLHPDGPSRGAGRTALVDGLPLGSGNRYFEGGEPDIRIGADDNFERVEIDGRDRLPELLPDIALGQYRRLRLSQLRLDPGPHSLTVSTSQRQSSHALTMLAPARAIGHQYPGSTDAQFTTFRAGLQKLGVETRDVAQTHSRSLVFRPGSSVFAISPNGEAFTVRPNQIPPQWLASVGLRNNGEIECFVETAEILIPGAFSAPSAEGYYLIYRRSPRTNWNVDFVPSRITTERFPATVTQPMSDLSPELLSFITADRTQIEFRGADATLSLLRQSILNARASRQPALPPKGSTSPNMGREHAPHPRSDLDRGPSPDLNPFNEFLEWMSEQDDGYCSLPKARQVFSWLWMRSFPQAAEPEFTNDVIKRLQDLGHVNVDKASRRLWIAPTVLTTLPNSRSLRVLTGSRAIEFIATLKSGDDDTLDEATASLLQNITFNELHSTGKNGVLLGPDSIYVQVASNFWSEQRDSEALLTLGITTETNLSERTLEPIPSLHERLDGRNNSNIPLKSRLMLWRGSDGPQRFGRWQEQSRLPDQEHFLKVNTGYSNRYMWWDAEQEILSDVGWAYGRWAFEAARHSQLLFHNPMTRQMLLEAEMPLPGEVSKALVARTGIMPRTSHLAGRRYKVFENVPITIAETIATILGQPKGTSMKFEAEINFDER